MCNPSVTLRADFYQIIAELLDESRILATAIAEALYSSILWYMLRTLLVEAHMGTAHQEYFYEPLPQDQQRAVAAMKELAVPQGHWRQQLFIIPNSGLHEATDQLKAFKRTGIEVRSLGTQFCCETRDAYRAALRCIFEQRVPGWMFHIKDFRDSGAVKAADIRQALRELGKKP